MKIGDGLVKRRGSVSERDLWRNRKKRIYTYPYVYTQTHVYVSHISVYVYEIYETETRHMGQGDPVVASASCRGWEPSACSVSSAGHLNSPSQAWKAWKFCRVSDFEPVLEGQRRWSAIYLGCDRCANSERSDEAFPQTGLCTGAPPQKVPPTLTVGPSLASVHLLCKYTLRGESPG